MMNDVSNTTKQNVIIFTGVDMCGKTNIATKLSRLTGIPYFKSSDERNTFLKNQDKFIMDTRYADTRMVDFLKQTRHSAIFDRGYPCEWVYSKFFGRVSDESCLRYIDDVHSEIGTKLIVTYRSTYNNIVDDLDPTLTGLKLKKLDDLYRQFSCWTKCQFMFLNVDSEDLKKEIEEIDLFLNLL